MVCLSAALVNAVREEVVVRRSCKAEQKKAERWGHFAFYEAAAKGDLVSMLVGVKFLGS